MKVAYLTNVIMPAGDAQSIQVAAMATTFAQNLNEDFILISPKTSLNGRLNRKFKWIRINISYRLPRFIRYLLFIIKSLIPVYKFHPIIIYSRDIGVVFIYKLLGFNAVYEIHKPFQTKIGNFIFTLIGKKIKIVVISESLKKYVCNSYNIDEKNILTAHDGVFLEDYKHACESHRGELRKQYLDIDNEKFLAMYCGSAQKGRGLEIILQVAGLLKDIIFVVVGCDRSKAEEYKISINNNIQFVDRVSNEAVPYYLVCADCLILPMTKETLHYKYPSPLKMFEYMASRVPIISSNVGSITEILNDENSYLFDPEKTEEVIDRIQSIRDNTTRSLIKSNKAFEDVKEHTWQNRVKKITNFFNENITYERN
ncbi:MAG: glycosyltransferase [bacterium]